MVKKYFLSLLSILSLSCKSKLDNDKSFESILEEKRKHSQGSSKSEIQENAKLVQEEYDILKNDLGLIEEYEEGILKAKIENKPIFLWFGNFNRVNIGKLEPNFLIQNKIIFQTLKDNYISIRVFVDPMQKDDKWRKFQLEKYNSSIQPYYYILNSKGKQLIDGMDLTTAKLKLEDELIKHKIKK